jgi:hypothetical protein
MPLYDYAILDKQGNRTGEYVRDVFQHIKEDAHTEIDGKPVERTVVRTSIQRTWHGRETESMALHFDPREIASIKADCPDIELNEKGFATFRNDAHQKKVYRQLEAAKERYQSDRPRVDPHADTRENDSAAKALAQKFGISKGEPACPVTHLPSRPPRPRSKTSGRLSKRPTTRI